MGGEIDHLQIYQIKQDLKVYPSNFPYIDTRVDSYHFKHIPATRNCLLCIRFIIIISINLLSEKYRDILVVILAFNRRQ